jgi:oligopeptide/dipeptide ABC transporter ATP-binding protein
MATILDVRNLNTTFATPEGTVRAVNDVNFAIGAGETLGIVGESGSGKSQIFMSVMGLLAKNGRAEGSVQFKGKEILNLPVDELNKIRGVKMSMIFQDPMTSLNPYLSVKRQMTEVLEVHRGLSEDAALKTAIDLLDIVQIPEARRRVHMYPHEFSGGMRQRVMIAMALLCEPAVLFADEPTTALDVTIQAQILELLADMKARFGMAVMLITHAMGVVAETAQRVVVMYAGKVIEEAPVAELFANPRHPYTQGLIRSIPRIDTAATQKARLEAIPGVVPSLIRPPPGCRFAPRCRYAMAKCREAVPPLHDIGGGHKVACVLVEPALEMAAR